MKINGLIIRTSWVYSEYGNNFVKNILRLGKNKKELNVVCDQIGSPTYANHLAEVILKIINDKDFKNNDIQTEIYHFTNEGILSWYEFAKEIFHISKIDCKVNPIPSKKYPTLAMRPKNTVMDKNKIFYRFGIKKIEKTLDFIKG